jgi:hypothetical protein
VLLNPMSHPASYHMVSGALFLRGKAARS